MPGFPQLETYKALPVLQGLLPRLRNNSFQPDFENMPNGVSYAAVVDREVSRYDLHLLREEAIKCASEFGFPGQLAVNQKGAFDNALSAWIGEKDIFKSREMLNNAVWTAMSLTLWPDLIFWRFGDTPARYIGGRRNALQRLWARTRVFDRGEGDIDRWGIINSLGEDELVQIMERPALGNNPRLARLFAESTLRACNGLRAQQTKEAIRKVTVNVLAIKVNRDLNALTDNEVRELFSELFAPYTWNTSVSI